MFRINSIEPFVMFATLLRWLFLASITGVVVGTGTSLFLQLLFYAMGQTSQIPFWFQFIFLPIGGLLNGLLIYFGYRHKKPEYDSIITAVHQQKGRLPIKTLPLKPIAAILTLASGGSAGKEGPASHIGGTLASAIGRVLHLNPFLQRKLVACGVSAGFASVFGTPIAGAIYAIEILSMGRIRHDYLFAAVIAGITSYQTSHMWGITYDYYPLNLSGNFSEGLFLKVIIIGIFCGLIALLFIILFEEIKICFNFIQHRFHIWRPFMPMIGGLVLALLIIFIPTDYLGLSLPIMDSALQGDSIPFFAFLWKSLLVAITLGSGFYGGIVTPQFVIGALSGNVIAGILGIDPILGASVGMVAVVAAASNAPIAAIFMGFELFGSTTGIYVVGACLAAYLIIGHRSVYPDQLIAFPKSIWLETKSGSSIGNRDVHLSYSLLRRIIRWQRYQAKKRARSKPPQKW